MLFHSTRLNSFLLNCKKFQEVIPQCILYANCCLLCDFALYLPFLLDGLFAFATCSGKPTSNFLDPLLQDLAGKARIKLYA
jgi:hypothetical protein